MWWELAIVLSSAYVVTLVAIAVVIHSTRPKVPPRLRFTEIHERALETRNVLLPAAAAAVLGFFVSLIASFVHDDFASAVATRLKMGVFDYLLLLFLGAVLSFAVLAFLLEKMSVAARDVTRHPASINRAAGVLLLGKEIDDLDAADLKANLDAWKQQRGKSAARVMVGRGASPRLNALLHDHDRTLRSEKLSSSFSFRLFIAKAADFWWTGALPVGALVLTSVFIVVTSLAGAYGSDLQLDWKGRLAVSLLCVIVQVLATWLYLRADAKHLVRVYRIDRIELGAAERRIATLQNEETATDAPRRGFVWRVLDAMRSA